MGSCSKKMCFALTSYVRSKLLKPLGVSHIKAFFIYLIIITIFHLSHYSSLHYSLPLCKALCGKTPSNRSAERPISCSTICPSNDYLAALWCDMVGWRGSIANILSLSLCISTDSLQLMTPDKVYLFLTHKNSTSVHTAVALLHQ